MVENGQSPADVTCERSRNHPIYNDMVFNSTAAIKSLQWTKYFDYCIHMNIIDACRIRNVATRFHFSTNSTLCPPDMTFSSSTSECQ